VGVGATSIGAGRALAVVVVAIALAVTFGVPGSARTGSPPPSGGSSGGTVATAAIPPCTIALPPSGVTGRLSVDGGPLPPNATGGVLLDYSYWIAYVTMYPSNGTPTGAGCLLFHGTTTTAANGSYTFVPPTPSGNCTGTYPDLLCTYYSTPYAPADVGLANGPPAGYDVSAGGFLADVALVLVYELSSVALSPGSSTVTTSVGAPTAFTAASYAANGSASDLDVAYSWSVAGTGWAVNASGPTASVEADPGAGLGVLTVTASASSNGTALAPVGASVDLVAVGTAIETAEVNRTSLDTGGGLEFRLTALGAAGLAYRATVVPGLGLDPVTAPCSAAAPDAGTVALTCYANVSYPDPGTAQPTANVTNGYSTADWRFPDVTVAPAPELEVDPAQPVGYVGSPVPFTVSAANGSGASPYQRACVAVASAPEACDDTAGPSWAFAPTFGVAGTFNATVWAIDGDGTNASTVVPLEVVPALAVGPISPAAPNATVSAPVLLSATVAGGAPPLRYWWNASAGDGPLLDGDLASDGPLGVTVVPSSPGPLEVTVTVVDRLGAVVAAELLLEVGPAAAERVAPLSAPPAAPVVAGTPVPLSWGAFTVAGAPEPSFAAALQLTVTAASAVPEAWVNASGAGSLAEVGPGTYAVPATAWVDGLLNVTLTVGTATAVSVDLAGGALPGAVPPLNLTVTADRAHVRLFDPTVARAGGRSNATLWRVADRFGNAAPGALLTVGLAFGGLRTESVVAAVPLDSGASGVWINYTAPEAGPGTVSVADAAGAVVLGPLPVAAATPSAGASPAVDALAAAAPIGVAGVAGFAVVRRRRRLRTPTAAEEELRELAEGRARAVELIGAAGALDLAALEAAWTPPPAPPALADWVASLVADGTLRGTVGEDGVPRFCLADRAPARPRVTVDPDALDRSLQRREEALGPDGPEPGDAPD